MRKLRLYLDTSVIGMMDSPLAPDKEEITKEFFRIVAGRPDEFELLISPVVIAEIKNAPSDKSLKLLARIDDFQCTLLPESLEAGNLADILLSKKVLAQRHHRDLLHMAYAIVARCDYIISWNFTHFVNFRTISRVSAVAKEYNNGSVFIVSPETFTGERFHEID
jgi:predicted nucleic acid-binding protein